ncbi:hypothetical protein D9758_016700 [Tetrapyrgos nigripes]|uniref:Uncharacterized protein n=1 Tax=Tetrapyrgos nigripes TaxID=182062 RepID=A0A8H5FG21_9AGAR|nr:hypothetical protein D9758_016700 [Tetrapyrgos nigripes]
MILRADSECDCEECWISKLKTKPRTVTICPDDAYRYFLSPLPPFQTTDASEPSFQVERGAYHLEALVYHLNDRSLTSAQRRHAIGEFKASASWRDYSLDWSLTLLNGFLRAEPQTKPGKRCRDSVIKTFTGVIAIPTEDGGVDYPWIRGVIRRFPHLPVVITEILMTLTNSSHRPYFTSVLKLLDSVTISTASDQELSTQVALMISSPGAISCLFQHISREIRIPQPGDLMFRGLDLKYSLRALLFVFRSSKDRVRNLLYSNDTVYCIYSWCKTMLSPLHLASIKDDNAHMELIVELVKCLIQLFRFAIYFYGAPAMVLFLRGGLLHSFVLAVKLIVYDEAHPVSPAYFGETLGQSFVYIIAPLRRKMLFCSRILNLTVEFVARLDEDDLEWFRDHIDANDFSDENKNLCQLGTDGKC